MEAVIKGKQLLIKCSLMILQQRQPRFKRILTMWGNFALRAGRLQATASDARES